MNLKNSMIGERIQTQKAKYCMFPFIWCVQNRQIQRDRKWISSCQRMESRGNEKWLLMGMGCFGGMRKCSGIRQWWWLCNSVNILKTTQSYTLKGLTLWYANYILINLLFKKRKEKWLYDFILSLAVYSVQIDLCNFWLAKLASTFSVLFKFLFIYFGHAAQLAGS